MTTRGNLSTLGEVVLSDQRQRMLDSATAVSRGPDRWRTRKAYEARRLLALDQVAGPTRMELQTLELEVDLRAAIKLHVPVALQPDEKGRLRTASSAVVGLVYPQVALAVPLPGFAVMCLMEPSHGAWYAQVGAALGQRMCLGVTIPVNIPVTELILTAYQLLSLQAVQLDPGDGAGVMNSAAAEWWVRNRGQIPLSREPFLRPHDS